MENSEVAKIFVKNVVKSLKIPIKIGLIVLMHVKILHSKKGCR